MQIGNVWRLRRVLLKLENILERPPHQIKNFLKKQRIDLATINLDVNPLTKALQQNYPLDKIHALLKNFSTINNKKTITESDIEQLKKKIELNKKLLQEINDNNIVNVQQLLVEDDIDLNLFKSDDNPLIYAIKNNKSQKIIEELVHHYININFNQFNGNSPLTEAVLSNNKNTFNLLLKHGADVNAMNEVEETPFLYLIKNKLMTKYYLLNFLDHNVNVNLQDNEGKSILMYLVETNELQLLKILLSYLIFNNRFIINLITFGKNKIPVRSDKLEELIAKEYSRIDIDIEDDMGFTSLMYASRDGNFELASILLTYKANVNKENSNGYTPLLLSCENDFTHTAKLLLQTQKVEINHRNRNGDTELTLACQNNNPELVNILLEYHADINIKNDKNYTPLHIAVSNDRSSTVKTLLEHHADVTAEDTDGNIPLILACQNQNPEIMEMLLEYHSDVHHKNKLGCTGMHYVKDQEMIRILLNYKANINERNNKGDSIINILCYPKNKKNKKIKNTLTYALDHGADINNINNDNENALIIASANGNMDIINLLLSRHIDFNHVKNNGDSALTVACKQQNLEIVNRLLEIDGIDVDPINNEGDSPFLISCQNNNISLIKAFTKHRKSINFNVKNFKEDFPLYNAVYFNNVELIKLLLEENVNMYEEGFKRFNPILMACSNLGKIEHLKLFIEHGADINRSNSIGINPLIQACKSNKIEAVRTLLQHAANPNIVSDHSTALIEACKVNNIDIVQELLSYGADVNLKPNNDMSALICLINSDNIENSTIIKLLIDYGADVFVKDKYGNSILYIIKNSNKIDKEKVYDIIIKAMKTKNNNKYYHDNDIQSFIKTYDDYTTVMATLDPRGDNIDEFSKDQIENAFLQSCIFSDNYHAELLLQKCPDIDVNLRETNGDTPLIIAGQLGNVYLIRVLLNCKADTTIISECHNNALFLAICYYKRHNDLSIIETLLDNGSNPNEICQYSYTALMMACRNELVDVVKLLLNRNADPNIKNSEGHTALSIACLYCNYQIVKLLLDTKNININTQTLEGETPLMIACENANGNIVSLLLQYNANISLKNNYGQTALHIACNKDLNPIIIQFLEYKKKFDLLEEDAFFLSPYQNIKLDGNTIFLSIVMDYEVNYLKTLINYYNGEYAEDNMSDKYINYLRENEKEKGEEEKNILLSSLEKKLAIVEHQTERLSQYKQIVMGELPFLMDDNINTLSLNCLQELLIYSTIFLNTEYIYKLLELKNEDNKANPKLDINYQDSDGNTALHYICSHKSQKKDVILYIINLFIQQHANINIQNNKGFTPLMYACQNCNKDVVKLLITNGADINKINHNNQTAIMLACFELNRETVNLLIEKGADLDIQDTLQQDTALSLACKHDDSNIIIKDLIKQGKANINIPNEKGNTPLIIACQNDNINIAKFLVKNGADINARNKEEQSSALHIAITNYNYSMMKFLLDSGANINIVNRKGETPLIMACKINNKYIAEYLLEKKAEKKLKDYESNKNKYIKENNNNNKICGI